MGIFTIALTAAVGYYIILYKIMGKDKLDKTQTIWDIILTFGLPFLFIGTFSGMATAVLAGVIFSILTSISSKI